MSVITIGVKLIGIRRIFEENGACFGFAAGGGARERLLFRLIGGGGQKSAKVLDEAHAGGNGECHRRTVVKKGLHGIELAMSEGGTGAVRIRPVFDKNGDEVALFTCLACDSA